MTLLEKLKTLTPTEFEHLVYDLLSLTGFLNLTWRTPGADGGRDIEGYSQESDISGTLVIRKWYIECKRYEAAIDWPTMRGKLAYAENNLADFFLLCTTSTLSPRCKDEVERYQSRPYGIRIRNWEAPDLENRVAREPLLLSKYQLSANSTNSIGGIEPLLLAAQKAVHSAYATSIVNGTSSPALELAVALFELVSIRSGPSAWEQHRFRPDRDLYEWSIPSLHLDLTDFDAVGLRALLCAGTRSPGVRAL